MQCLAELAPSPVPHPLIRTMSTPNLRSPYQGPHTGGRCDDGRVSAQGIVRRMEKKCERGSRNSELGIPFDIGSFVVLLAGRAGKAGDWGGRSAVQLPTARRWADATGRHDPQWFSQRPPGGIGAEPRPRAWRIAPIPPGSSWEGAYKDTSFKKGCPKRPQPQSITPCDRSCREEGGALGYAGLSLRFARKDSSHRHANEATTGRDRGAPRAG